ncbi:unnamed protein product [Leuciscus chuanchicus]
MDVSLKARLIVDIGVMASFIMDPPYTPLFSQPTFTPVTEASGKKERVSSSLCGWAQGQRRVFGTPSNKFIIFHPSASVSQCVHAEPTVAPEQTKGKRNTNNLLLEQA